MITEKMKNIVFYMKNELDNNLKKYNITTVQLLLLIRLNENTDKEVILKDICEYMSLRHSTVIEVLKKLEAKGYIKREKNYKSVLSITENGKELLKKIGAKKGFIEDKLLEGFDKEEIEKLSLQLDKMYKNIQGAFNEK